MGIPPAPGLNVCGFGHCERRGKARKQVAVILAFGHALGAHEALGSPDALSGLLEVFHRLFEDGVFVGYDRSIWLDSIIPRVDRPGYPSGCPGLHNALGRALWTYRAGAIPPLLGVAFSP